MKQLTTAAPVGKAAAPKATAKSAPRRPSVEIEEVYEESDYYTSIPPRSPRHILDGSDDDIERNPAPEPILVDDDEGEDDEEKAHEAPEESPEAELSMFFNSSIRD